MKRVDFTGQTFFKLRVLGRSTDKTKAGASYWDCLCECGRTTKVTGSNLLSGTVMSCGCWLKVRQKSANTTHGLSKTPEYNVWKSIKQRTTNPNCSDYPEYGGRGIIMSPRWIESFENFISDMGPRPSDTHSVDRRENTKGYEPDNCYWATPQEQANNKARTLKFYFRNQLHPLAEIARLADVPYEALRRRLAKGETTESAIDAIRASPNLKIC